jgi:thymidylate kinase
VAKARSVVVHITTLKRDASTCFVPESFPLNRNRTATFPGLWIALYGPDGAGKSAVARRLVAELAASFSGVELHHLRIPLWRTGASAAIVTQPHAKQPRGLMLSCLKLFYMFAQSWMAHLLRVLPSIAHGQLVIFDRYFLDYAIDPRRYRLPAASVALASLLGDFAPQPDLQFVLDVPAPKLQGRKAEVSLQESQRQRREYQTQIAGLTNTILVDADRPISEVTTEIRARIFQLVRLRSNATSKMPSASFQDAAR